MIDYLIESLLAGLTNPFSILYKNRSAGIIKNWLTEECVGSLKIPESGFRGLKDGDIPTKRPNTDTHKLRTPRNKDIRFKELSLKNFRKFPPRETPYARDDNWKLSFSSPAGMPCSCIFLGNNGCGKTSLYTALEYLNLNDSAIAKIRGYKNNQDEFIKHLGKRVSETYVDLTTLEEGAKGCIDRGEITPPLGDFWPFMKSFFCSEWDVVELERGDKNKSSNAYILDQIGLGIFSQIITQLEDEVNVLAAPLNRNKANKTVDSLQNIVYFRENPKLRKYIFTLCCELLIYDEDIKKRNKLPYNPTFFLRNIINTSKDLKGIEINPDDNYLSYLASENAKLGSWIEGLANNFGNLNLSQDIIFLLRRLLTEIKSLFERILQNSTDRNDEFESLLDFEDISFDDLREKYRELYNLASDVNIVIRLVTSLIRQASNFNELLKSFGCLIDGIIRIQSPECVHSSSETKRIISDFKKINRYLTGVINNRIKTLFLRSQRMLEVLLKKYMEDDYEKFRSVLSERPGERQQIDFKINFKGHDSEAESQATVRLYFNTFRMKLFCMSLKMALAFSVKKLFNINFPVVVDDIFDSSDFPHRVAIRDFIREITTIHDDEFVKGKDKEAMPLQLIYFTQDEVTAQAIYRGLKDAGNNEVRLDRLFDFKEILKYSDNNKEIDKRLRDGYLSLPII